MYNCLIFCIVLTRGRAGRVVLDLREAGFSNAEISALFIDPSVRRARLGERGNSESPDESGMQPGAVIHGAMGWIAARGFRMFSGGDDPLIAAGPIVAALGDKTASSIADRLTDLGVPPEKSSWYEHRIREGQILLSVSGERPGLGDYARAIFVSAGVKGICATANQAWPKVLTKKSLRIFDTVLL